MGAQARKYSVSSLQIFMMCLLWLSSVPGACIVLYFFETKANCTFWDGFGHLLVSVPSPPAC